jgi:hypothetical protein
MTKTPFKKKQRVLSFKRLSSLIGGMTFLASVFELLNLGRLIEMFLAISSTVAFGIEIFFVITIITLIELFIERNAKKKGGES